MANKKKSKKKILYIVILILLGLFILPKIFFGNKEKSITVKSDIVLKRTITQIVFATGKINPEYKVIITPEVTGEIVDLPVKEGDNVDKGQILIKLKPDTYMAQLDRANASLRSALSSLKMTKSQLNLAQAKYKRNKKLFDQELINRQEMDQFKSDLETRKAQYESQMAQVSQSRASLKETREILNKTVIKSPMDGTISQLNVE